MDATAQPTIRLDQVSKHYPNGTSAVDELSLDIATGELVMLIGPSGCGDGLVSDRRGTETAGAV
jgi:ABC-type Fe3+/spermidine/putrescine transport system ATPase subunit